MQPEPDSIAAALTELFSMEEERRQAIGSHGRRLVEQNYSWDRIGQEMVAVYEWVLQGGAVPKSVVTDS